MELRIGKRSRHAVNDFAEASAVYCTERDKSGEGYSTFPHGVIKGAPGKREYYVSYNGKVWNGKFGFGTHVVYNPYAPT